MKAYIFIAHLSTSYGDASRFVSWGNIENQVLDNASSLDEDEKLLSLYRLDNDGKVTEMEIYFDGKLKVRPKQ